jgi:hypothetical protein
MAGRDQPDEGNANKPQPRRPDAPTVVETTPVESQGPVGQKWKNRYIIERELGRGGIGVVYLARDEQLHSRPVVIKALLERSLEQGEWYTRKFREECEALSRLDHPGVVGVFDSGETEDGKPFLVMQYVDGITLRAAMRERMPLERVARIVRGVGQALTAAHERGICHRDLKPENIMLQDLGGGDEQVKIIDFGIATVRESQAGGAAEATRVAGSTPYMAPEQLLGKPCPESDTFALGVIAYELLTGQRPFQAKSPTEMFLVQREGVKAKPSELRRDVSAAAEESILKALALNPATRYPRARDFGEELGRALQAPPGALIATAPIDRVEVKKPPSRRGLLIGGGAVIAAGAAALLWYWLRPEPPAAPRRSFHYSIQVQKHRDGKPLGDAFLLPGEMIFQADFRIRILIGSEQAGHLYVLNEGPETINGLPSYNILHPGFGEPAAVAAGQPIRIPKGDQDWIVFDQQEGTEKLWMFWAAAMVPELEAAKEFARAEHGGAVSDPGRLQAIRALIERHAAAPPEWSRNEAARRTDVRGSSDILVRLVKLEHH